MTRGDLIKRASYILGAGADPIHGTDEYALLGALASEAVIDILTRTRLYVRAVDLELTGDTKSYDIGQQVLKLWNLKRGNTELVEVPEGDSFRFGAHAYSIVGFNVIQLAWEPETGDILTAWYTPRPTAMTLDAHDPSAITYGAIPPEFHDAIVNYMAWKGADIFGDAGSGRGEKYRIYYEGQDGTGAIGSNLGRVKTAINMRAQTGAAQRRIERSRVGVGYDGIPPGRDDYWRG